MSLQTFRTAPDAPDFDEAAGLTCNQVPTFDEAPIDPDYDEGSQGKFADEFTDPDSKEGSQEGSQEYQPRKRK